MKKYNFVCKCLIYFGLYFYVYLLDDNYDKVMCLCYYIVLLLNKLIRFLKV